MTYPNLDLLIAQGECEWIDFKEKHHENKADLIHDILCLANASHQGDRFLIFGVSDTRAIIGIKPVDRRRSQAEVINFVQSLRLNHQPTLTLIELVNDQKTIDVIIVRHLPEKPYYLLQDYLDGGERVRAGAIYMRNGDTNTPKDRSTDDVKVERMFRERFGIDLTPYERLHIYLRNLDGWRREYGEGNRHVLFYEEFPEFVMADSEHESEFREPWVRVFPDGDASRDAYVFKYHTTVLRTVYIVWCDGARYATVMPKQWASRDKSRGMYLSYYFVDNSFELLANRMFQTVYPISSEGYLGPGFFPIFSSEEEAARLLETDLADGCKKFIYFRFKKSTKEYVQIVRGTEFPMWHL